EAMKRDPGRAVEFFSGRVGNVGTHPELRSHLRALAESDPKLLLAYLPYATREEFPVLVESLLTHEPGLAVYTPEEKLRFFRVWHDKGDSAKLVRMLEENLNWRQDGWTVLAGHRAKEGNFRAAYEVAISNVTAPPGPGARRNGNLADLDRAFRVNPTDFARGLDLYETQRQLGRYDEALATLDQLAQLPQAPAKILYERGVTLAGKGDYARAWDAVSAYAKRVEQERKDL
ncbi:MAG: hypothetical protein ABL994_26240, partial [Verrucomicrobiales bacterium]